MTNNQKKIIRTMKWIFYPAALFLFFDFVVKFLNRSPAEGFAANTELFKKLDQFFVFAIFLICGIGVLALMQHFFSRGSKKSTKTNDAANAKLLLKIEAKSYLIVRIIFFQIVLAFAILLNLILFIPNFIFDQSQIESFSLLEKCLFGFFYIIAHFLLLVFGLRLINGMPPVFIATEKGFCYEPSGISSGWILWKDILEVRESQVLAGSNTWTGPRLDPVLGIKLTNPEEYNAAAFAPLLQYVVSFGQKLHNYQTEGVGDLLLIPSDFGNEYEKVKTLIKEMSQSNFKYYYSVN